MSTASTDILLQQILIEQRKTNDFLEEIRDDIQGAWETADAAANAAHADRKKILGWFPILQSLLALLDGKRKAS